MNTQRNAIETATFETYAKNAGIDINTPEAYEAAAKQYFGN